MLSPTNGSSIRVVITSAPSASPENFRQVQVWRSWLEYRSRAQARPRFNWNALLGLLITAGISAGFWTAIGVTVAHFWK
ncbi:MAG TPA: hypothetical protein VMD99_08770 [Terriglobales bacterium]|nr:hypothetical protein [Terriglobales bacterium]